MSKKKPTSKAGGAVTPGWELTAPINAAACRALARKKRADAAGFLVPQVKSLCHQAALAGEVGIEFRQDDLADSLYKQTDIKMSPHALAEELRVELMRDGFVVVLSKREDQRNWERRYIKIVWGGADS